MVEVGRIIHRVSFFMMEPDFVVKVVFAKRTSRILRCRIFFTDARPAKKLSPYFLAIQSIEWRARTRKARSRILVLSNTKFRSGGMRTVPPPELKLRHARTLARRVTGTYGPRKTKTLSRKK
jgi:hypothetical protein